MLWAADVNGRVAGLTRPWFASGAATSTAETQSHVVTAVQTVLRSVFPPKQPASTRWSIVHQGDRAARIQVDASPALSPDTGAFVGYLGSIRPLVGDAAPSATKVDDAVVLVVLLDAVAENVVAARALAVRANERRLVKVLDLALLSIGDRLAETGSGDA